MKFGGLSEKDVSGISMILEGDGIPFSIDKDEEIEEFNSASMKNDLRHYTPPNISSHILAVTIVDETRSPDNTFVVFLEEKRSQFRSLKSRKIPFIINHELSQRLTEFAAFERLFEKCSDHLHQLLRAQRI